MLARRIIAVSPDKAFGKQLATALKAAGGSVDLHTSLDGLGKGEIQASLVVLHLEGALATAAAEVMPRITDDTRVIVVLPKTNLAAVVDILQSNDRITGMLVQEDMDSRQLTAMATRVLIGDIFGLEKMVMWGTLVHSQLVGDYQEKSLCISQIGEFAESMGVRRKYREAMEQCLDEMLMNALYDAPVDEAGKQIFSEIPTKTRISLRVEQKVVVQYACDGHQLAISVRDAFGTLERNTVLKYLYKCLHAPADQQIDRKQGGAGLGLYLMVNSATTVFFNVLPGVATEAVCVFSFEQPKLQLHHFGFFNEKIDAGGRLAAGQSKRLAAGHPVERRHAPAPPATPRGLIPALAAAITVLLALIAVAAWPRMFPGKKTAKVTFVSLPKGATIEIEGRNEGTTTETGLIRELEVGRAYPVVARLEGYDPKTSVVQPQTGGNQVTFELVARTSTLSVDSQPQGATVEVDGKSLGTTPTTITTLPPGSTQTLVLKKAGFTDARQTITVPGPGKELALVLPMQISDQLARVKLVSEPTGAQVIQNGQLLAGVTTPAEILVEAGKSQKFTLTLPDYVPAVIPAFTPGRGEGGIEKKGKLVPGTKLHIETNLDGGKVTVSPTPQCKELVLPADCVVAPGQQYTLDFTAPGARATHTVNVNAKATNDKFEFGYVDAADGKHLVVNGKKVKKNTLEVGNRTVTVVDEAGQRQVQVQVKAGATVTAQ